MRGLAPNPHFLEPIHLSSLIPVAPLPFTFITKKRRTQNTRTNTNRHKTHKHIYLSSLIPDDPPSLHTQHKIKSLLHATVWPAMPLTFGAALQKFPVMSSDSIGLDWFAPYMWGRALIYQYMIYIFAYMWPRALIYEQSATLSCRDIPVGHIELFEQIELSGSRALPANLVRPCHPSDRRQMFEPCD